MIKDLKNYFKRCYSLAVSNHYNERQSHFDSVVAEQYNRRKLKNIIPTKYDREGYFGERYDTLILKLKAAFKQMPEKMQFEIMGYVLDKYAKLKAAKSSFDKTIELEVIERIKNEVFAIVESKPVAPAKKASRA